MSRKSSILCGAFVLLSVLAPALAAAAKGRSATRRVELVVARPVDSEAMQRFETALRDALLGKGVVLSSARKDAITPEDVALATMASPDEAASTVSRVFINFATPGHATLFLIDPRRGRIHVRRVMLDHGFDVVARESALFVIEQSIDAILEGREIGVSREEYQRSIAVPPPPPAAPPPAPVAAVPSPAAPPAPPPIEKRTPWLVAGGYEGVALGAGAYQHAAKLVVGAQLARAQIAVAARIAAPLSIARDGVEAQLWSGCVSLSMAATLLRFGDLSVRAGLGAGLDVTRVAPATTQSDLQAAAVFWAADPLLRGGLEVEQRLGRMSVAIALGAEAHLLDERYTVRSGDSARDVFVPHRVRPEAAALVGTVF